MLSRELLFFFSALGVFNSCLLSLYLLFFTRKNQSLNRLLGLLILAVSIRVGVSCIYFFEVSIDLLMIQLGLSAHVLAGVFLLTYIQTKHTKRHKIGRLNVFHILGILALLLIGGILYPFSSYRFFWDHRLRYVIHAILTVYVIASAYSLRNSWIQLWHRSLQSAHKILQLLVFVAFALTCTAFVLSLYINYVLGPILFSFIFYTACLCYFYLKNAGKLDPPKYANKQIRPAEADFILANLHKLMKEERMFKKSHLKLSDLASALHISTHQLSQVLNDNLGQRFTDFINTYRIEEAKMLLVEHSELTVEAIAYEVGFNAKSSFYTTFKSHTQQTPAAFKASQLSLKGSKL